MVIKFKELLEGAKIIGKIDIKPKEKPKLNDEGLPEGDYIYTHKGKWIIRTDHNKDRFSERPTPEKLRFDLYKKSIEWTLKNNPKEGGVYAFLSKSTNIGMLVVYRKDKERKVKGNHLIIITWFGDIKKLPKPKTIQNFILTKKSDTKVILESIMPNEYNIEDVVIVEI